MNDLVNVLESLEQAEMQLNQLMGALNVSRAAFEYKESFEAMAPDDIAGMLDVYRNNLETITNLITQSADITRNQVTAN